MFRRPEGAFLCNPKSRYKDSTIIPFDITSIYPSVHGMLYSWKLASNHTVSSAPHALTDDATSDSAGHVM